MQAFLSSAKQLTKTAAISFFILGCMAGISYGQGFRGGLAAGITASEVSGDRSGGANKLGLFASVYTDFAISERAFWHIGIMFIQKGSREYNDPDDLSDPLQGPYRDYTFSLQYVEVPIMYKINFPVLGGLRATKYLGGEIGMSVSRVVGHSETNDLGVDITRMMAEDRPFYPAELNLIMGFNVPIGESIAFTTRFTQGVTPLRNHASAKKVWFNRGQYNTCWTIGLSYTIF